MLPIVKQDSRLKQLTTQYVELREKKRKFEQQVKDVAEEMSQIELELIPLMEELDAQNIKLDGIGTVYLQTRFYVRAIADQMEGLVGWLDQQGLGGMAKRSIHYQTLQSEYQKWSEQDQPLPPKELVEAFAKTEVRVRKAS